MYLFFFRFFSHLDYHRILSRVPCAIEWVFVDCFIYSSVFSSVQFSSVAQSCPTHCDLMDCSLPGSSVHGILPGKNTGVGCQFLFQGIFPTQGLNPCPLCLLGPWRVTNKDVLYITGNSTQYSMIIYMRKESKKKCIYV